MIKLAIRGGFMSSWKGKINRALHENKSSPRPSTLKQLVHEISLSYDHYCRAYRSPKSGVMPDTLLRYAHETVLGVEGHSLSPSLHEYVAHSTLWLEKLSQRPRTIGEAAASAYAAYVVARVSQRGRPMGDSHLVLLAGYLKTIGPADPILAILDTAEVVGDILLQHYPESEDKMGSWDQGRGAA